MLNDPPCVVDIKGDRLFHVIPPDSPYRPTATFALWKREALRRLLKPGESAWEFEKKGARRCEGDKAYFSCVRDEIVVLHLVLRGKLIRGVKEKLRKHGYTLNTDRTEISRWRTASSFCYVFLRKMVFSLVPFRYRKFLVRQERS